MGVLLQNNVDGIYDWRVGQTKKQGGVMAKDITDYSTIDFIAPAMSVVCGQVLQDRHRHVAIVVKKGKNYAHLVRVRSGTLRLEKCAAKEIVADWQDTRYPFSEALTRLMDIGRRQGMTEGAKVALEGLLRNGKEPLQAGLF